jgi:Protein of unknown function (DUF1302)
MRQRRRESLGLPLAVALLAVALCLGIGAGRAFAQDQGTPWYEKPFFGSAAPLIDLRESPGPLQGLSITGFFNNTTGMWVNSDALSNFSRSAGEHHGKNALATERNWLQLDFNYHLGGNDKFFLRFWGVYEPPYAFDQGNILDENVLYTKNLSDFYNRYEVRDAWWKHTMGPLTLFLGRQIVTWGESLAFRVGDVINPQDFSWNFGFANLEQSRLPLWMVHPVLNLPSVGPFQSNFFEGVWAPAWQPMYNSVTYPANYYQGRYDVAGAVDLLAPFGGRFDVQSYPCTIAGLGCPNPAFPQDDLAYATPPFLNFRLPAATWANSKEGFRLHTIVANSEITAIYWHARQLVPIVYVEGAQLVQSPDGGFITPGCCQVLQARYPQLNDIGLTMNRPLYLPGAVLSQFPFVLRTEGVWQDHTPFNTVDPQYRNAVVYSSTLNTLVALDLDQMYAPWLTSTGTLTVNFEWNNYTILSPKKSMVYDFYAERWRHNEEQLLFSTNTSWWWGAVLPTFTMIYNPSGNTWLLFPTTVFTPPWTSKYFLMLEYIGIMSNDKFNAFSGGVFKGKSILLFQFQYNFNLVQGVS